LIEGGNQTGVIETHDSYQGIAFSDAVSFEYQSRFQPLRDEIAQSSSEPRPTGVKVKGERFG